MSGECASVVRVYLYGECMVSAIVWYERDRDVGAREIERERCEKEIDREREREKCERDARERER